MNFENTNPTLVYNLTLIEAPIRAALASNPQHATLGFPVRTGAGRRSYHLELELLDCAAADGTPCFDKPNIPNNGKVLLRRADETEQDLRIDGMDWKTLEHHLQDFMLDWNSDLTSLLDQARAYKKDVEIAQHTLRAARNELNATIRRIKDIGGITTRDISKLTGVPGRTVSAALEPITPKN